MYPKLTPISEKYIQVFKHIQRYAKPGESMKIKTPKKINKYSKV